MTTFIICSTLFGIAVAFICKDYKLKSEQIQSKAYIEANRTRNKLALDASRIKEENLRVKVDLNNDKAIIVNHVRNYCHSINSIPKTILSIFPLCDDRHKIYHVKFCHSVDENSLTTTIKLTINFNSILFTEVIDEEIFDRILLTTKSNSEQQNDMKLIEQKTTNIKISKDDSSSNISSISNVFKQS